MAWTRIRSTVRASVSDHSSLVFGWLLAVKSGLLSAGGGPCPRRCAAPPRCRSPRPPHVIVRAPKSPPATAPGHSTSRAYLDGRACPPRRGHADQARRSFYPERLLVAGPATSAVHRRPGDNRRAPVTVQAGLRARTPRATSRA